MIAKLQSFFGILNHFFTKKHKKLTFKLSVKTNIFEIKLHIVKDNFSTNRHQDIRNQLFIKRKYKYNTLKYFAL